MTISVDMSDNGVDWAAIVDNVSRTGSTVRLTRDGEVVAEVAPPRHCYATVADLIVAMDGAPRLGADEAESFAADLEMA